MHPPVGGCGRSTTDFCLCGGVSLRGTCPSVGVISRAAVCLYCQCARIDAGTGSEDSPALFNFSTNSNSNLYKPI